MKRLLVTTACVAVVILGIDRAGAISPTNVGTVRLVATGHGSLGPPPPLNCLGGNCPDHLYVRFDHGPQAIRGSLDVPLEIKGKADPFTLCNKFKGSGNLGELSVEIVGDICAHGGSHFS